MAMTSEQILNLVNTIRDNATQDYQDRIPEATKGNFTELGGVLAEDIDLANEFSASLINKVAYTDVHHKVFKNPLAIFKKGVKPYGDSIEEIMVNFAKGESFDPTGAGLLNRKLPDVKTVYHQMNRQDKYKVTITADLLKKAFRSFDGFNSVYTSIIESLYNGDNMDEFVLFKQMFAEATSNGCMVTREIPDPVLSPENATEFIKMVKLVSTDMQFPKDIYNGYLSAQKKDRVPVETFSTIDEQLIVIDAATSVSLDVDVLAKAFNLDRVSFLAKCVVIDAFPDSKIRCAIVDKKWGQIYDDLYQMRTFTNGEGLYDSYILHHWQTIAYSPLVNAVAFVVPEATTTEGE